jgi:hypothetical protein
VTKFEAKVVFWGAAMNIRFYDAVSSLVWIKVREEIWHLQTPLK